MSKQNLREQMPVIAAIVMDLREIFGQALIDQLMRRAMKGEPTFWATEAGIEFGTKRDSMDVPIIDGRGIFFSIEMPNGAALQEWMDKVKTAMNRAGARLKAAADKQDGTAQASGVPVKQGSVNAR